MSRILVVDDKDENVYYLEALLRGHGHAVVAARHGAEALVLARQSPPDVIVSDLLMPIMDGYTLLRHWKADAQLRSIPFVVYTATYTESEDEQLAYNLGADGFILKPAEPDVFVSRIAAVMARTAAVTAAPKAPSEDETAVLRVYSETLIRKLEEKTLQLEESNRALQRDLAARQRAEAERQKLVHDLGERVKELGALRAAATILQDSQLPESDLLQDMADLLPPAMQYPEVAAARAAVGPVSRATAGFAVTDWMLEARFTTRDGVEGALQVAYREARPPAQIGPFLAEEDHLLRSVGDMLRSHFERRRAEAAQRASESMLRTASRIARLGAWAVDLPSRTVVWSDELRAILEVPDDETPGVDAGLALYPPEWRDTIGAAFTRLATDGTPFDVEVESDTFGGRRLWVRVCGEAERGGDGTITRVHGTLQDLTERKSLEQQFLRAQRLESIGTLAGGIAHDLNNVLSPIILSVEMLKEGMTDPFQRELVASIGTSARRGADMVRQVLAFARGVEGQRVPVAIDHLVHDIERIANDTFLKSIRVVTRLAPGLPPVLGDRTQLHQVLLNLSVNARDAMPDGGQLTISATGIEVNAGEAGRHPGATPGQYVLLTVADTGRGMAPSILDRVFEPFFTTKEHGKGTGLGLPTSLAIVTSHQGFIDVQSQPGHGTTFRVFLPVAPAPVPGPAAPPVIAPMGRGELILVVDDEDLVRDMIQQTLRACGYQALGAADGAEAVRLYAGQPDQIAAVITDMMMPVMDGAATIEAIRAINPDARIIGTSGLSLDDQPLNGETSVPVRFLSKPYTTEALLAMLHLVLHETRRDDSGD